MKVEKREHYVAGDKIKFVDVFPADANLDEDDMMIKRQGTIATVFKGGTEFPVWMLVDGRDIEHGLLINEDKGERNFKFAMMLLMFEGKSSEDVACFEHWYWKNDLIEGVVVEE